MNELKPCPFCGAIPQCGVDFCESSSRGIKLAATVECTGCGIRKRDIFKATDYISLVPFYDYDNAFARVIKEWNKRVGEQDEDR